MNQKNFNSMDFKKPTPIIVGYLIIQISKYYGVYCAYIYTTCHP